MQYTIVVAPRAGVMSWEVRSGETVLMSGFGADYTEAFHRALTWLQGA